MALLGSGAAITTTPAQSAPPAGDCAVVHPVSELTDDQAVTGLTVVEGTEPVEFTGTYLGKLNGGIGAGVDMLMFEMDFDDPRLDEVGIWQGMSGSPVYAADGRLIGAVAYGLSTGPSLVAGVTPYEDMDDYMGAAPPESIRVPARQAREIAAETGVSAQQAGEFRQLPMALTLSGLREGRLAQMKRKGPKSLDLRGVRAGSGTSSAADAGPESLVAGGNLGAAAAYGDVTLGGVGTVTSVCEDRLVGFGHPMTFGGRTTLGMMPAEAVYVHGDKVGPGVKLANMGDPAGTIDHDHLTGVSGALRTLPPETDVTSSVTYGERERTGTSHSLSPDFNAEVTFAQILANHDRVVDGARAGSESATFTLKGTADGEEFDITFGDRYTSDFDITFESVFGIADTVWALSAIDGVTLESVTADGEVYDSTDTLRVGKVQQQRGGRWVTLGRRSPAVAAPGRVMRLRIALEGRDGVQQLRQDVTVPRRARGAGFLSVTGGAWTWSEDALEADTVPEIEKALRRDVRNDQVETRLSFWQRRSEVGRRVVSEPGTAVVEGERSMPVVVRR